MGNNTEKQALRFDFAALAWLEEKGFNLLDGADHSEQFRKASTFLLFVQAGLQSENAEASIADARAWTKGMPARAVIEAVTAALQESIGSDAAKPANSAASS